jgi:hypothetical protein
MAEGVLVGWQARCEEGTRQVVLSLIRSLRSTSDAVYTEWISGTRCVLAYSERFIGRIDVRNGGELAVLHFSGEMTDRVVTSESDVRAAVRAFERYYSCCVCKRRLDRILRCSGCRVTTYCSQRCQAVHWSCRHDSHEERCAALGSRHLQTDPDATKVRCRPMPVVGRPRMSVPTRLSREAYTATFRAREGERGLLDLPRPIVEMVMRHVDAYGRVICRDVCYTLRGMVRDAVFDIPKMVRDTLRDGHLRLAEYVACRRPQALSEVGTVIWCRLVREMAPVGTSGLVEGTHVRAASLSRLLLSVPPARTFKVTEVVRVACRCGSADVVRALVWRVPREERWRAMLTNEAARGGSVEVVDVLYLAGFRVSRTASRIAGEMENLPMLEYLARRGLLFRQAARRVLLKRRLPADVYRSARSRRGTSRLLGGCGFDCLLPVLSRTVGHDG